MSNWNKGQETWLFAEDVPADALQLVNDVVCSLSIPENEVLFLTRSAVGLYEYPYEELLKDGLYWKKAMHPDDKYAISIIRQKLEQEGYFEEEYRIKTGSGRVKWVKSRGKYVFDENNNPVRLDIIITEVTRLRQMEARVHRQEERYMNIIDNMNLGYLEVDNDDVIQYANQRFLEMSGYQLDELKGKKAKTLFLSKNNRQVVTKKNKIRKGGVSDSYEVSITDKQGKEHQWLISGAPHYNDNGDIIGSVGIHLDATANYKLTKAKEAAIAAARAKSEFLANMSHEMRTPLNAVIGFTDLLLDSPLNDEQKQYLTIVFNSANNLLGVINDILDFSKMEAGKLSLDIRKLELRTFIDQIMDIIKLQAAEKGLQLKQKVPLGIPRFIWADPVRLQQILVNLLSNAVKFTSQGEVEFKVEVRKIFTDNEAAFRFTVRDTGIGIAKKNQKKIFEAFLQEDTSTTRKFGGTGLGLTIVNRLLGLMNSGIKLESESGKGSTFYFDINFKIE